MDAGVSASWADPQPNSRNRRPRRRALFCPDHPEQLKARGMSDKKARLVINAYPVLVLSDEWLEELFCPCCAMSRWCHVTRHDRVLHSVAWAPRDLWQQVAHVDVVGGNPTVSEFTSREAARHRRKTAKGKALFDPG